MSEIDQQKPEQDVVATQAKLQQVQSQFGAVAADYVISKVHASGQDLAWLVEAAELTGVERVLDVATGGGHAAFALAPYAAEVVALDLTRPMLEVAQKEAEVRKLPNIRFLEGDAQYLPCEDASFDVVVCRQAAHHFPNVRQCVSEWARVLKPGGKLLLIDSVSPEEQEADAFLEQVEILRDPSHVRNQRISQWNALLNAGGFAVELVRPWGILLDMDSWTQRMRTPPEAVATIEGLLRAAAPAIRTRLQIELRDDGTFAFVLPAVLMVAMFPVEVIF